ncbi:hypothetical protein PBAC_01410 [Pedobacter glucosidilyticus]|nr:hypothetical protein [Pedobacter glucosidilyticus]KHJ39630.1 hypothetical protein PBAC_01410 [Pedobacter glucosidilyticus]
MIEEVSERDWVDFLSKKNIDLSFHPDYLTSVAISFNCIVKYVFFKDKEKINFAIAFFNKRSKVILPEHFTHNPIWINLALSERKQLDIYLQLVKYLKSKYSKIVLKLNTNVNDIRAFKWEGFNVETRYTYIRKKGTLAHKSIESRIKKSLGSSLNVQIDDTSKDDITINVDFLKVLNFNRRKRESYLKLFSSWKEKGFLKSFSISKEKKVLGVFIVLLDKNTKKISTLMINGADRNLDYLHATIYNEINKWSDENGFEEVDYCGANFNGIAQFKSLFYPELKPYFLLRYSKNQNKLRFIKFLFEKL